MAWDPGAASTAPVPYINVGFEKAAAVEVQAVVQIRAEHVDIWLALPVCEGTMVAGCGERGVIVIASASKL